MHQKELAKDGDKRVKRRLVAWIAGERTTLFRAGEGRFTSIWRQAIDTKQLADLVGTSIELAGIAVLVIGAVLAFIPYIKTLFHRRDASVAYRGLRRSLGKATLIGLELLVAADIIRSVALAPSFATVGVLGMIVVIRTFLSWSLELEINGRWPWQGSPSSNDAATH